MERIGFIGLGIMGEPMARNLIEAGYQLVVHNRSREPVERLSFCGAVAATNPKEVAQKSDIIITMLPDSPVVEEVVLGEDGVLRGACEGSLIVDMGTTAPFVVQDLASKARERGVGFLDAPVSGGEVGAIEGILSIMVGGTKEDFERARPIFDALGKSVVYVGESGAGQVLKACNQVVIALTIQAVAEALVLGSKVGIDPTKIVKVLSEGLAGNRILELRAKRLIERDFEPGGKVSIHHKDLGIALALGREYKVSLPLTAIVNEMFGALEARGQDDKDHTALMMLMEDWAQHIVGEWSRASP